MKYWLWSIFLAFATNDLPPGIESTKPIINNVYPGCERTYVVGTALCLTNSTYVQITEEHVATTSIVNTNQIMLFNVTEYFHNPYLTLAQHNKSKLNSLFYWFSIITFHPPTNRPPSFVLNTIFTWFSWWICIARSPISLCCSSTTQQRTLSIVAANMHWMMNRERFGIVC